MELSLAGAQDKLPVIAEGNEIGLPLGNTPSTHILKPEPDRFPGLAVNEVFCMTLARAMGLSIPNAEYRLIGKKSCILVQRYDRTTDKNGHTSRVHQEDFCQALGMPPERKYQAEGGPKISDCVSLLRDWSTAPALDIPHFVNALIFNVLIGNADAHGKNYSLLYANGERRLSPFYDLVSTLAWPALTRNLAMEIGGSKSVNAFTIGGWRKMTEHGGLAWPIMRDRMAKFAQTMPEKLDETYLQTREYDEAMAHQLSDTLTKRAEKMRTALNARSL